MPKRTPSQIAEFVRRNSHRMDVPVQFLGDEPNSYQRDWDASVVRVCLFACWNYEGAAGNLAIPMVYRTINEHRADFLCDRSYFYSTPRDLRTFEAAGYPVFGIESKHELMDFDVIGTSISYPVLTINFVKQLLMSDIPPTWEDRRDSTGKVHAGRVREPERWPMVMVGGQLYGAPEVAANIVDVVVCGEIEDEPGNPGIGAVMDRVDVFKVAGIWATDRMRCYRLLAQEFSFLYFPALVDVHYAYEERPSVEVRAKALGYDEVRPSKQVIGYSSGLPGMRMPVKKRFVKDLNNAPSLVNPPLLYQDPGLAAGDVEANRGCPAWCSFCALSWRQKPYRQRSPEVLVAAAAELVKNTGAVHISPFGPDFPMYTQKKQLVTGLLESVSDEVDSSSLRVDDFIADPSYIMLQAHGGLDSVTIGVEGNSQRMRDFVGKGAADEDVKEVLARGIRAGINKFKLYMIAALPGEDEGDIRKILGLAKELADIRDGMGSKARIQFSWTPMLIEGNTPFQWFAPTTVNYALGEAWEHFRDLHIDYKLGGKAQKDKLGYFQLTQRASREVGMAMVEAVAEGNAGCWGGAPRGLYERVDESLRRHGFLNAYADCYDERRKHDMFGWEFVDQGTNVELMWATYQQMVEFLENTDSESYDLNFGDDYHGSEWIARCDDRCLGKQCGVCDADDLKLRRDYIVAAASEPVVELAKVKVIDQRSVSMKVRMKVFKSAEKRQVMNDHYRYAIRRAANRAGLPITKRSVRFATDNHKFKDWTSGVDFMEFGLTRRMTRAQLEPVLAQMNDELRGHSPVASIQLRDWTLLPASATELRSDVDLSLFDMELDVSVAKARSAMRDWDAASYVPMIFKDESYLGITREEVNGKEFVDAMWLVRDGHRLRVRLMCRGKANPYIVYAALFGKLSWVDAAKQPAVRVEAFVEYETEVVDFFRPSCKECGAMVPVNPLDKPYDLDFCPLCKDKKAGVVVASTHVGRP